jgi:hypothetical protein
MFHSELNYDIVRMRRDELVAAATRHRGTRANQRRRWSGWSRWFHRGAEPVVATTPSLESPSRHLHAVPPPRHERQPTGHDDSRVA